MVLRCAALALVFACALQAQSAEAPRFAVTIDAPAPYDGLLARRLALMRLANSVDSVDPNAERLRRLARDAQADARNILETEGFYDASVEVRVDGAGIVIRARPGERARVAEVVLSFQGPIAQSERLQALRTAWELPVERAFRHEDWENAKQALVRAVARDRYPRARIVASEAIVDPQARSVRLVVEIASGPAYSFGALEVIGATQYPATLIERLDPPAQGEPYSQRRLAEFQSRLQRLPYFANVLVSALPADDDPDDGAERIVPVRVELAPAARRRVDFGVGFSTNTGARAQIGYTDHNLFERAWRWRNLLKLEQQAQSLATELALPRERDGYNHDLGVALNRNDVQNIVTRAIDFNAKRARIDGRVERAWTLYATASDEQAAGAEATFKKALVPGYSWRYRFFDDPAAPRRGYDLTLALGGGAKAALSDQNFVRGYARLVATYDLSARDSVLARLEGGAVLASSRDGIPLSLLFRAGGEQSVRGYAFQSIGVREGVAVAGGRYLAIGGAEYVRWITREWGVALFVDSGDAFDDRRKLYPKIGYGVGARWRSPAGPLNVDLAYGHDVRSVRLHLSVGFLF